MKYLDSKKSESYLHFINSLQLDINFANIELVSIHSVKSMTGWCGIETLVCLTDGGEIYDVDIRYAWEADIFKQDLFDNRWNKNLFLTASENKIKRFKLIIYLCKNSINLGFEKHCETVPERFLLGKYWETIDHVYLQLPTSHPFIIPDHVEEQEQIGYSTASLLIKDHPSVITETIRENNKSILFSSYNSQPLCEGGLSTKGFFKTSSRELPLVSVITVVFNGEKYIEQTIQSVINQSYANIEYLIIDGGSTDETVNIIRKYDDQINYWISEPDKGIYNAMNKALCVATGDWIFFLGSDDILFNAEVIHKFIFCQKDIDVDIIFGDVIFSNNYYFKSKLNYKMLVGNTLHHQSCFYRKYLFNDFRYQDNYKIGADYELNLKIYTQNGSYKYISSPVSIFRYEGESSRNRDLGITEMNNIRSKYVNYILNIILSLILKVRGIIANQQMGKISK
ncbi:MAG: glycosyltransferase [Dolichospermum sp. BR01]|nr:glycosyltransferase [Dolichospermum sp. BR01]